MKTSYDILLNSEAYVLARSGSGAPAVTLGKSAREPGQHSQIGTVVIDSLHGGFGQAVSRDPLKYFTSSGPDASVPGQLSSPGETSLEATLTNANNNGIVSSVHNTNFIKFSDALWFLITPGIIYSFDPSVDTPTMTPVADSETGGTLTGTSPYNPYFTGSYAIHGDFIYFGVATTDHVSSTSLRYKISTNTWDLTGAFGGPTASYFHAVGNRIWYSEYDGTDQKLYWSDSSTGVLTPLRGPFTLNKSTESVVTNLWALGPYLLIFLSDNTLNAIDEDGVFAPLIENAFVVTDNRDDFSFGFPAKAYLGGMIFPHSRGIAFMRDISQINDISPVKTNPHFRETYPGVSSGGAIKIRSLAVNSEEIYAGTVLGQVLHADIYEQVGFRWHNMAPTAAQTVHNTAIEIISTGSRFRLWIAASLATNTGACYLYRKEIAFPNYFHAPAEAATGATDLRTSYYTGEGLAGAVTKRFISVRGYGEDLNTNNLDIAFNVDGDPAGGSDTAVGSVTTAGGFFSVDFPKTTASLGRGVQLVFDWPAMTGADTGRVHFPMYIDYEYVPDVDDYVRFNILASPTPVGKKGVQSTKTKSQEIIEDEIAALVGNVHTLVLADGNRSWTVLVESYTSKASADDIVLNEGESVVEVLCRRLA